jgi:putative Mg2+ transporter-C (MgtC) family protein
VLRRVLTICTERGFAVAGMHVDREDSGSADDPTGNRTASVTLSLTGRGAIETLTGEISELTGVLAVGVPTEEE